MQHGDKCDIWASEGGQWFAKFKKGACVFVLKAFKFSCMVAGQIPTGWEAGRYGLPEDIIADRPCHSLGIGLHSRSFECIGDHGSV